MPTESDDGRRRWRLVRAGTDAVPASLRRLMSRARPPQLASVPWRLIGLVLATVGLLGWIVLVSPVFGVRQVEVSGLLLLDEEQVLQAAAVPAGKPLARVDVAGIRSRVGALAPAESVEVSRGWPATLRIAVIERTPVAAIKRDNLYHVFDRHGVTFLTSSSLPADVVEVKLPAEGAPEKPMKAALRVIQALTPQLRSELVRLVVNGPAGIQLVLRKDRMVTWGDAEESDLKAKVATALLAQKGKQIDVSVPEIVTIQ